MIICIFQHSDDLFHPQNTIIQQLSFKKYIYSRYLHQILTLSLTSGAQLTQLE